MDWNAINTMVPNPGSGQPIGHNALQHQIPQIAKSLMQTVSEKQEKSEAEKAFEREQKSAREAMAFSAEQAKIQREWEKEQHDTTYQRTIADLRKAGINPAYALHAQGGQIGAGSAQAPQGIHARGQKSTLQDSDIDNKAREKQNANSKTVTAISTLIRAIGNLY